MLKKIFLIVTLAITHLIFSQESAIQTEKYTSLCKIWGFLKYYHPNVTQGKFNWDDQLITKLNDIEKIDSKEELNNLYVEWITNLGEIKPIETKKNSVQYFEKNFSLDWFKKNSFFSPKLNNQLSFIEKNRAQNGFQHYIKKTGNKLELVNELEYGQTFPSKEIRLVEFFRLWNLIEYFYPHKYRIENGWDTILKIYTPKIIKCTNQLEYHLLYTEILSKINDSHSGFFSYTLTNFYGRKRFPFIVKSLENKLIITGYNDKSLINENETKIGDIILKIDGKTIEEIYKSKESFMIASNDTYKYVKFIKAEHFLSTLDKVTLTIERSGKTFETEVKLYSRKNFNPKNIEFKEDKTKWKKLENNIGYVNLKYTEKNDVSDFYKALKDTKAIIFDIRNYPNFIGREIVNELSKSIKASAIYAYPSLDYPGKYILNEKFFGTEINSNPYKGKIVILVNENSISRSEWTAMQLQTLENATTIGSQTAGADGEKMDFKINGAFTGFTTNGIFYPNGDETQINGVKIDIISKPTLKGFLEGKDEVLERAIEFINTNK